MKAIPTEMYKQYKLLIYKQAWKWAWESGWDVEELKAEGNLVFCECVQTWKKKAKFSTYLWGRLNWRFQDLIWGKRGKYYLDTDALRRPTSTEAIDVPEQTNYYENLMENIPPDCKRLVRIVLSQQCSDINTLQLYLRKQGWKWNVIEKRIKRVKSVFQENRL